MRITSVSSNVKFGSFEKTTAQMLLENAKTPQDKLEMKQIIITADKSKDTSIFYDFNTNLFNVFPPAGTASKALPFKDVVSAVKSALDIQKQYDDTKYKMAKELTDEEVLNRFTEHNN